MQAEGPARGEGEEQRRAEENLAVEGSPICGWLTGVQNGRAVGREIKITAARRPQQDAGRRGPDLHFALSAPDPANRAAGQRGGRRGRKRIRRIVLRQSEGFDLGERARQFNFLPAQAIPGHPVSGLEWIVRRRKPTGE
ncbi:MAG: hypothetical protein DYG87_00185 [Anaerolineae bacterium CFX3]|nr:hypothetical protein [Anaerolineae bacterium CFX3]MCQ3946067.1 hypothetical protein [Anaerolineae bacterium]